MANFSEDRLNSIQIKSYEDARAVLDLLLEKENIDRRTKVSVACDCDGELFLSWINVIYFKDGTSRLEPIDTVDKIKHLIRRGINGEIWNPDGWDE